jgi:hypothetical protein
MHANLLPRLLAGWMEAGFCGGDWRTALDLSAHELEAEGMVLICQDRVANTTTASVGSKPSIDFVLRCRELARRGCEGPQQCYALHLGFVSWACADVGPPNGQLRVTVFALHRERGDPSILQSVASIAACCVGAKARFEAMRTTAALKAASFDRLPFGVAIVDEHGRVAEMNAACRDMIARADGISLVGERLQCRDRGDQAALSRAVSAALHDSSLTPIIRIARASGGRAYVLRAICATGSPGQCLLMIADPDGAGAPFASDVWRAALDLTDGELMVAEGIVANKPGAEDRFG